jgi:septal ring factor EnvC (AmiA/AmiB activator)
MAAPQDIRVDLSLVQTFLILGAMLVGWAFSLWRMAKVNQKKESDLYAEVATVKKDINEVGTRVNNTNLSCGKHDEAIQSLKIEQQQSRDDRINMRERIASNFAAIQALQEELQQERIVVMSTLHANERAAAERDTLTRVELAQIKERLNIETMVQSVVRNMKVG